MRNFLVVEDLTPQEIEGVFSISQDLETKYKAGVRDALFPGRVLALVFEKQSLRTRVSFQTAMVHLGGSSLLNNIRTPTVINTTGNVLTVALEC